MSKRRCFISAKYGDRLDVLQRVLDHFEVAWEWATSAATLQPAVSTIVGAIKKADFVIGVLHDLTSRENVVLELGMAIGLNKSLLLLTSGEISLPSELSNFQHFTTDLQDEKILSFQLDLFLRSLESKRGTQRSFQWASTRVAKVEDEPPPELFESALEQSVAAAISRAGGRVTIPSRTGRESAPDLLMWLPQLDKDLFNPAAIEVAGRAKLAELAPMQLRLADFIRSSGLRCGLIVVNSVSLERELRKLPPIPYIFVLGLNELKSKLETSELAIWLRRERNRLAHGVR